MVCWNSGVHERKARPLHADLRDAEQAREVRKSANLLAAGEIGAAGG